MRWWSSICRFPATTSGVHKAIENAGRILKETRCQAVKLEGGADQADVIRGLVSAGIPVMAHCRPAAAKRPPAGRLQSAARRRATDGRRPGRRRSRGLCDRAGMHSRRAGREDHRRRCKIPTIGIGAGAGCDGQVLVINDLLGITAATCRKFVKAYADLKTTITDAVTRFRDDVRGGKFPGAGAGVHH